MSPVDPATVAAVPGQKENYVANLATAEAAQAAIEATLLKYPQFTPTEAAAAAGVVNLDGLTPEDWALRGMSYFVWNTLRGGPADAAVAAPPDLTPTFDAVYAAVVAAGAPK
jgi:hypothetical protein